MGDERVAVCAYNSTAIKRYGPREGCRLKDDASHRLRHEQACAFSRRPKALPNSPSAPAHPSRLVDGIELACVQRLGWCISNPVGDWAPRWKSRNNVRTGDHGRNGRARLCRYAFCALRHGRLPVGIGANVS
jgi:hypothetical protein